MCNRSHITHHAHPFSCSRGTVTTPCQWKIFSNLSGIQTHALLGGRQGHLPVNQGNGVSVCIYLVVIYRKKSYARAVPSPNLLLSSLLLKSWIFLALITSASSLFQASMLLYEKLYFLCLSCSPFQFLLVSSCCSIVPNKQIISINYFKTFLRLYTLL